MSIRGSEHIRASVPYGLGHQQLANGSLRIRNDLEVTKYDANISSRYDYYLAASNRCRVKFVMTE